MINIQLSTVLNKIIDLNKIHQSFLDIQTLRQSFKKSHSKKIKKFI